MIKNYLLIAFRNLWRNKFYTFINLLGLITGISFSCMLYVYVSNELSYDRFHTKSDRIYRVLTADLRVPENERVYAVSMPVLEQKLKQDFTEVENSVRLERFTGQVVFEIDGQPIQERNWFMTTVNLF